MYELIEKEGRHYYSNGKNEVPGLSAVLSAQNEYGAVRRSIMEETSALGTAIHAIIKRLCDGDTIHEWYYLDARIRRGVAAYDRFKDIANYKPRHAERIVVSEKYGFGTTEDSDGDIPLGHIICDWKAVLETKMNSVYQLAATAEAHEETFKRDKLEGGYLVRLDKETGRPHPIWFPRDQLRTIFDQGFIHLLGTWKSNKVVNKILTEGERWHQTQ